MTSAHHSAIMVPMTTDPLPTLSKITSTGATQTYRIWVEGTTIVTEYGQLGGKMQQSRDTIAVGKNLGKANATTPEQQALLEAEAQWTKKLKNRGYIQGLDATVGAVDTDFVAGGILPMLAHTYEKQGKKVVWPAFVQPKLDGHRCIAVVKDGTATLWSRTRKPILSMPHIIKALESAPIIGDITLDGELFVKGPAFEQLTSLIRPAYAKPGHEVVELHVYDVVTAQPFVNRLSILQDLGALIDHPLHIVETREAQNEEEAMEAYADFVADGYEGAMLRNASGVYESKRSYNLIKVKAMADSEWPIVDVVEGRGKMSGRGIFVCETDSGSTFRVKMAGPLDSLCEYLINKDKYVGLDLTVQFQELTADGLPRFPVGLRIRQDV